MEDSKIDIPQEFLHGLFLFAQEEYYEAHEAFEIAWRQTKNQNRAFYRALLQISGGFYRVTQGRPKAAKKFFEHALKWLAPFPIEYLGMDVYNLKKELNTILDNIFNGQIDPHTIKQIFLPLDPQETR